MSRPPPVQDKAAFKKWCNTMLFDVKQVAFFMGVSPSNIYKYLDEKSTVELRKPIMVICDLVNALPKQERAEFVTARLEDAKEQGVILDGWPASDPIPSD